MKSPGPILFLVFYFFFPPFRSFFPPASAPLSFPRHSPTPPSRNPAPTARHRRQQPGLRRCWVGSFRKLEIIIDGPRQTLEDIGYQTRPQIALLIAPRVEFDLNNVVAIR